MGRKNVKVPVQPKAKSLKQQRAECLAFLYENILDIESWLGSARTRFRGKRIQLGYVMADIDGAENAAHCTIREAKEQWPDLFKT